LYEYEYIFVGLSRVCFSSPWPTCMVLSWILEPWCAMRCWWSFRITWPSLCRFLSESTFSLFR